MSPLLNTDNQIVLLCILVFFLFNTIGSKMGVWGLKMSESLDCSQLVVAKLARGFVYCFYLGPSSSSSWLLSGLWICFVYVMPLLLLVHNPCASVQCLIRLWHMNNLKVVPYEMKC